MIRILGWLGLVILVWTEDHDGEHRLRMARKSPFGKWHVRGLIVHGILLPDGKIDRCYYMSRWCEWKNNRRHVIFE